MNLKDYIHSRGLTASLVAQEMGVSKQAISCYGKNFIPTNRTLKKVADAMTTLGAPTSVVDLVPYVLNDKS